MQTITIAGRLGRDAELRNTQSGDAVCNFSVAVDVRQGREKVTNWWRVSLWGKRAEALNQYLTKGASVTVMGEFSLTEYEGKPQLNIRANEIALLGGGQQDGQRQGDTGGTAPRGRSGGGGDGWTGGGGGNAAPDIDDEIPFATRNSIW
jgi:single-strand DNA-binding protein